MYMSDLVELGDDDDNSSWTSGESEKTGFSAAV